ncbi:DUF2474 domain-containing protein [Bradyrhizobium sp. CB1650]|nr:DUF2474 domain-containing protein [Bradyrhizobium sp. CB1650]WGD53118.1 DUF2474 domain-containing protein [Bradyrhizobium sp. CB1650]
MKPSSPSCWLWTRRIGWMLLIWTASIVTLAIAALSVRLLMNLAGLAP